MPLTNITDRLRIRITKLEVVPQCGSYEVGFADGREPKFFYFDDVPSRRCSGYFDQRSAAGAGQGICPAKRVKRKDEIRSERSTI